MICAIIGREPLQLPAQYHILEDADAQIVMMIEEDMVGEGADTEPRHGNYSSKRLSVGQGFLGVFQRLQNFQVMLNVIASDDKKFNHHVPGGPQ